MRAVFSDDDDGTAASLLRPEWRRPGLPWLWLPVRAVRGPVHAGLRPQREPEERWCHSRVR
eukprot:5007102-Pyramimonas_sp.AAC.1